MGWVWIHNVFDTGYKLSSGELMAEEAEAMCVKWILGGNPLEMMPEVGDIMRYQCQWSKLLVCNCFCRLGVANTIDDIWECNACRSVCTVCYTTFYPSFSVICFIMDDVTIGSLQRKTSSNAWRERMEEEEQVWVAGCWASRRHLKHCR